MMRKLKELRTSTAEVLLEYLLYMVSTCDLISTEASKYLDFFTFPLRDLKASH